MQISSCIVELTAQPWWLLLLSCLGLHFLFKHILSLILKWALLNFLRPAKDLKSYGSWAVLTGATDGIGKSLAVELARHGLSLVLIGRNPAKLNDASVAIRDKVESNVEVRTVVVDLEGEVLEKIAEAVRGLQVGVLVNCAAVADTKYKYFNEVDEEMVKSMIKVNVESSTKVTLVVLKGMLERKRGLIVNVGSGTAIVNPCQPRNALYSATKAYLHQFSRSLYVEYKKRGIDVECLVPLYVSTKMVGFKKVSFFTPAPDEFAKAAMRWMGHGPLYIPYWRHRIQYWLSCLIPDAPRTAWLVHYGIMRIRQPKLTKRE